MSGLMTNNIDQIFKALTENLPITKDQISAAKQEYANLRLTAQVGEKLNGRGRKKGDKPVNDDEVCPTCNSNQTLQKELVAKVRQLQTELNLKSQMCLDLQEQLQHRQTENMHGKRTESAKKNDRERAKTVGEMYSQIYDNQWMEAYQYLDNIMNLREDRILEILQRIIRGSFVFCQDIAEAQIHNLGGEITCPLSTWTERKRFELMENGSDVTSQLVEITKTYRKTSSTECVPNLQKSFSEVILPTFFEGKEYRNEYVIRYAERCVAVSWYMTVQDPPMFLFSKIIRKSDFDSELFRPYTKSGDKYDYLVWPALLLYENGPVIEKGIAQPLDSGVSPLSLRSHKTPVVPTSGTKKSGMKRQESNNAALKGTPWGSQVFASNDPNAPSPSIDLPKTPTSVKTPRDSARGDPPIISYPASPKKTPENQENLTATWKP